VRFYDRANDQAVPTRVSANMLFSYKRMKCFLMGCRIVPMLRLLLYTGLRRHVKIQRIFRHVMAVHKSC